MPSKGVAHRHTKHKTERNRLKREGKAPALAEVHICSCGFRAKNARGLAIHKTRRGH